MVREEAYERGIADGMAKFAISRFRQYARTQFDAARQNPAAMPQAMNTVNQAYPPRTLGGGSEGQATRLMLPQALEGGALTPTVRKVFPASAPLSSPTLVNRRIAMGPELNKNPAFAKFYGSGRDAANRHFIDSEFIPHPAGNAPLEGFGATVDRSVRSAGMKAGLGHLTAKDVRGDNVGFRRPGGAPVTFDYMPMRRNEVYDKRYTDAVGLPSHSAIPKPGQGPKVFPNLQLGMRDTPAQAKEYGAKMEDYRQRHEIAQSMQARDMAQLQKQKALEAQWATERKPVDVNAPTVPMRPQAQPTI